MEDLTNYLLKKAFPLFFTVYVTGWTKKAEGPIFNVSSKKQFGSDSNTTPTSTLGSGFYLSQ